MAAENDILGVSGHLDISDIINQVNHFHSELQKIGNISKETAEEVEKAFKAVNSASEKDLAQKTKEAISIFTRAFEEAKTNTEKNVSQIESSIERLQSKLAKISVERSDTIIGSKTYDNLSRQMESLNTQIHNQQQALSIARVEAQSAGNAYSIFLNGAASANSLVDTFIAANSVATGATAANATAHIAAGIAIGNESMQHKINTEAIDKETEKIKSNTDALKNMEIQSNNSDAYTKESAVEKLKEYSAKLEELAIKLREAKAGTEEYQRTLAEFRKYDDLGQHLADFFQLDFAAPDLNKNTEALQQQGEATQKVVQQTKEAQRGVAEVGIKSASQLSEELKEAESRYKEMLGLSSDAGKIKTLFAEHNVVSQYNAGLINDADMQRIVEAKQHVEELRQALKEVKETPAETTTSSNTDWSSVNKDIDAYKGKIEDTEATLKKLQIQQSKLSEKDNLTEKEQKSLEELNQKIRDTEKVLSETKNKLSELNKETFFGRISESIESAKEKIKEFTDKYIGGVSTKLTELKDKVSNSNIAQRFKAEYGQVNSMMGKFGDSLANIATGGGRMQNALSQMGGAFGALGLPLSAATKGVQQFALGLLRLSMTPVGAVIAAIVIGVKALTTWFHKSVEGQEAFAQISAVLSSVLKTLTDIVVILGEYLFHAFADANGPLHDFTKSLVITFKSAIKTVSELVGGLGTTLKGIFTFDWDLFKEGVSQMGRGLVDAGKTAMSAVETMVKGTVGTLKTFYSAVTDDQLGSKLSEKFNSLTKNASIEAQLAKQQFQNQKEAAEAREHSLELDKQIAANREKIYTLTGKEKDALIEQTKQLLRQKYEGWTDDNGKRHKGVLETQREELRIAQTRNNLHSKSLEQIGEERSLREKILQTENQQLSSTRMLTRMQEANRRAMANAEKQGAKREAKQTEDEKKANAKITETAYTNEQARIKAEKSIEEKIAEAKISAMEEGFERTQAERKRQQKEELDSIEKQRKEAIEAERKRQKQEWEAEQALIKAKGGSIIPWDNGKFIENEHVQKINQLYDNLREESLKKQIQDERKEEDALIKSHQSYTDKKLQIDREYKDALKAIDAAIIEAEERGDNSRVEALKRSRVEANKQRSQAQADLSLQQLKETPDYIRAFEDLGNTSTETLEYLISEFEKTKDSVARSLDPEKLREYTSTIRQMYDELYERDPFRFLRDSVEEYTKAISSQKLAEDIYQRVKNGQQVVKSVTIDDNGKIVAEYWNEKEALDALRRATDAAREAGNRYGKALRSTLSSVDELANAFANLGESIGGIGGDILGGIAQVMTFTTSAIDNITKLSEISAMSISSTMKAVESASVILSIASIALQLVNSFNKLLPTTDSFYEKAVKKQKQISNLRKAVEDYELSVLKARQAENKWFASSGIQDLRDAYEENGRIAEKYYSQLYEAQEKYHEKSSGLSKATPYIAAVGAIALGAVTGGLGAAAVGAMAGAGLLTSATAALVAGAVIDGVAGAIVGAAAQSAMSAITYKSGQVQAKDNLRIQTRHKSFWRGEKTEDLQSWLNKQEGFENARLFDDNNLINAELAQQVIDKFGDKLVGQTKETLEELIKLREEYDEYIQQIRDYVSEMYSPLVDNITDALFDWLGTGKDTLDSFKDYANDTFKDIAKDMVRSMVIPTLFKPLQTQLESLQREFIEGNGSISMEQYVNNAMDSFDKFLINAEQQLPSLQQLVSYIDQRMRESGINIMEDEQSPDQKATYNSLEKWTYEQADELINRATAMQIIDQHQYELQSESVALQTILVQYVGDLKITAYEMAKSIADNAELQDTANKKLDRVIENTNPISEIRDLVKKIYNER